MLHNYELNNKTSWIYSIGSAGTQCRGNVIDTVAQKDEDVEIVIDTIVTATHCVYNSFGIWNRLKAVALFLTCLMHTCV